jgi:hypothetical protein
VADDALTADQDRALLKLEPNQTCGFVRNTYLSPERIAASGLPAPFGDGRPWARRSTSQLRIPFNTFHTARITAQAAWFRGGSAEWPGVIPADVELGDVAALAAKYPTVAVDIRAFPEPVVR